MTSSRKHFMAAVGASLLVSAAGLAMEIAGARLLAPLLGNSTEIWTGVITVVLAGFAVGHAAGGWIAEMDSRRAGALSSWLLVIAGVAILVVGPMLPSVAHLESGQGLADGLLAAIALFFLPATALSVPAAPLLHAVTQEGGRHRGVRIGIMYGAGSAGAIVGSFMAGYVLIPLAGVTFTMNLAAAACFASAVLTHLAIAGQPSSRLLAAAVIPAIVGFGSAASPCDLETGYYCVRVVEKAEGRYLILDRSVHSAVRGDGRELVLAYQKAMAEVIEDLPGIRSAVYLGGGGYALPVWHAAAAPDLDIQVVEIDPSLPDFVEERLGVDLSGVKAIAADARRFIAADRRGADLVVLDVFSSQDIPPHLVTSEFFAEVKDFLGNGYVVANIIDVSPRPRLVESIAMGMKMSFDTVKAFRVDGGGSRSANYVVVAGPADGVSAAQSSLLDEVSCSDCNPVLLTDDRAPASLIRKASYLSSLVFGD